MKHFLLFLVFIFSSPSLAKDMSSRIGFGYSDQFSVDNLESVAVRYYSEHTYGYSAAVGIDTTDKNNRYGALLKAYKIIFPEKNLNFYMGAGLGFLSVEVGSDKDSGVEVMGIIGAEFFLPGLDNLGFSFEAGLGVSTVGETHLRTIGDHPLKAGIIFYL